MRRLTRPKRSCSSAARSGVLLLPKSTRASAASRVSCGNRRRSRYTFWHTSQARHEAHAGHAGHGGGEEADRSAQAVMGHGGHHGGGSMEDMARDMRNRFLVALILAVPITIWSPLGRDVLGLDPPLAFGLRDDVFTLILSLPVVFYSAWIFFDGAYRALRAKTLDMMVLVAVAVGAGWLYSLVVTLTGGGEVFYELRLADVWVWDIYRSNRFVRSVRVVTFKDVNIEELNKQDISLP